MSVRPRHVASRFLVACLVAVAIAGTGAMSAAAETPGEITGYAIPAPCYLAELAPAARKGVLLRVCDHAGSGAMGATPGKTLANVLPSGDVVTIAIPESSWGPVLARPEGDLWVGANVPEFRRGPVSVERVDAAGGAVESFPIPAGQRVQPKVLGLAPGEDGAIWAAVGNGDADNAALGGSAGGSLVRLGTDGSVTTFPVPHRIEPRSIVQGPDGNLWFTAIQGRWREEHTFRRGVGFVGRLTPSGGLSLYRLPRERTDPKAITVGPDGALWFGEPEAGRIGTIGTDGKFGRRYELDGRSVDHIAFGPEGDAWLSGGNALVRLTLAGQRTRFPIRAEQAVAGPEGDIWVLTDEGLARVVPGAPGLDAWSVAADRRTRTVGLRLACGGSTTGCAGRLELALGVGRGQRPIYRFGRTEYSIAAESRQTLRIHVSTKAFSVASRPLYEGHRFKLLVRATVEGGPPFERWMAAPSFVVSAR